MPILNVIDSPPVGEITTTEVGESVVRKARIYQFDAYLLLREFRHDGQGLDASVSITLSPGFYIRTRTNDTYDYYISELPMVTACALGLCNSVYGGFVFRKDDPQHIRVYSESSTPNGMEIREIPDWKKTTYSSEDKSNLRRELIYNGLSDSTVRFLYREFISDMARPAFSQELTYDLDAGSEIGFRGVRIEILEATNVILKYRVLIPFNDL